MRNYVHEDINPLYIIITLLLQIHVRKGAVHILTVPETPQDSARRALQTLVRGVTVVKRPASTSMEFRQPLDIVVDMEVNSRFFASRQNLRITKYFYRLLRDFVKKFESNTKRI